MDRQEDANTNFLRQYQPPPRTTPRLRLSETQPRSLAGLASESESPVTTTLKAQQPLSSAASITSFLGYMQRRLSDFVVPSAAEARALREQPDPTGRGSLAHDGNGHLGADAAVLEEGTAVDLVLHQLSDSPSLHRAGLLQPKSYNAPSLLSLSADSHSPDSIRATTLQLSNMPFPASASFASGGGVGSFSSMHRHMHPSSVTKTSDELGLGSTPRPLIATPLADLASTTDPTTTSAVENEFIFPQSTSTSALHPAPPSPPSLHPSSSISSLSLAIEPERDHDQDQESVGSQSQSQLHSLVSSFLRDSLHSSSSPRTSSSEEPTSAGLDSSVATLDLPPPPVATRSSIDLSSSSRHQQPDLQLHSAAFQSHHHAEHEGRGFGEGGEIYERKRKQKQKKLSGLSLLRPAHVSGSGSSDASPASTSRSSSVESSGRVGKKRQHHQRGGKDEDATPLLGVHVTAATSTSTRVPSQSQEQTPRIPPNALALISPPPTGAETTPTGTPMGTPRPLVPDPLPPPSGLGTGPTISVSVASPPVLGQPFSPTTTTTSNAATPTQTFYQPRAQVQAQVHWRSPNSLVRPLGPSSSAPSSPKHRRGPGLGPLPLDNEDEEETTVSDEHTPLLSNLHLYPGKHDMNWNGNILSSGHLHAIDEEEGGGGCAPGSLFTSSASPGGGDKDAFPTISFFKSKLKSLNVNLKLNWQHHSRHGLETLTVSGVRKRARKELSRLPEYGEVALKAVPAVLLGCLLNILDGVSYGMIIFPATGVFADLGPMGVSMFFVSAVVAQLVYTFGGSGFAGANGSMMIEVVPFFHILATSIANQIGDDDPNAIIATTLVAYALSSVLTGLTFFFLGALKLGVVVGFFPRHILVGCIGGVGAFLIKTGLTVSMRIPDDDFDFSWNTFQLMFLDHHNLLLWTLPLALAILLRLITHRYHHQLIFPAYFIFIPVVFYVVVFLAGLDLERLRKTGWIFDMAASAHEPWYKFWSYLDLGIVRYSALWSTLPTQFALLFFNILHPPLNVPALAVSLNTDVDTNKELVAHGYSNLLSGLIGSVPNYLVYVNTLLFYRVGGDNRIAGFLLAVATAALLIMGTGPIAYIPVLVVGALIYVLGIDLVKEALWDNRHRVTWSEYITIISIMVCMTVWDFVIGVLFGIIVCCFFFVVQNSQLRSIRAMYTGDLAVSAVRRPSLQRAYIREVSKQTTILRLQGFLFFGTITYVEETIRNLLEGPYWFHQPIQFLVLDLSLVAGVDMSSAEAFVRIQRLLAAKRVTLVFCGFTIESQIGKALRSVEVLGAHGVELFSTFNDAMEWTENAYLRAWFRSQKIETSTTSLMVPGRQDADIEYSHLVGSFVRSPRRSHLRDAGDRTIATEIFPETGPDIQSEPINTLTKAFSSYGNVDPILFNPISRYLQRMSVPAGHVLWKQGDPSSGLYIIESGVLRAMYEFESPTQRFEESMVAGTLAGEMSALSDSPRNATVIAEQPSVLWKLSNENIQRLQIEEPELARVFTQLVLKAAKLDYDILLSAIASRQ